MSHRQRAHRGKARFAHALLWLAPLCVLLSSVALARPGGGHTFGGSSDSGYGSSGSHHSSDSGIIGELIFLLIRLVFVHPLFGIPLLIIVLVVWTRAKRNLPVSWETSPPATRHAVPRQLDFTGLYALDPDFSRSVFEDFAYRLYAATYRARHDAHALGALAPYFSADVQRELGADPLAQTAISNVVVGALKLETLLLPSPTATPSAVTITLAYTANLSTSSQTFYQHERWQLQRDSSARTKAPEQTERLGCPNCGAPFESADGRRCGYCNQVVADGRFAWQVVRRTLLERQARPPALTSNVTERGTNLPSVVDPDAQTAWQSLSARDPAVTEAELNARLAHIYGSLNTAWSALDLRAVRALVSDSLFDYLRYWTEAYTAQGLQNRLEQMQITRVQRVKVVLDRHFDAITLRLWASGLDFTVVKSTDKLVTGSRSTPRAYTEYWTLIRAANAKGAPRTDPNCPSCAAPLQVTLTGACQHCGSHITRGEFDWVLSKIEQDDVYAG